MLGGSNRSSDAAVWNGGHSSSVAEVCATHTATNATKKTQGSAASVQLQKTPVQEYPWETKTCLDKKQIGRVTRCVLLRCDHIHRPAAQSERTDHPVRGKWRWHGRHPKTMQSGYIARQHSYIRNHGQRIDKIEGSEQRIEQRIANAQFEVTFSVGGEVSFIKCYSTAIM